MLYLPPLRRFLLPSLLCLAFILYYKSTVRLPTGRMQLQNLLIRQPELTPPGTRVTLAEFESLHYGVSRMIQSNQTQNFRSPPLELYYNYNQPGGADQTFTYANPESNPHMAPLWQCPRSPNAITDHIRLPNPVWNISLVVRNETENERKGFLNPAILSLPWWSENQYLVVSRVMTDGSHMQNLLCEANICYTGGPQNARPGERPCTDEDLGLLGGAMGMRCATPPITLNVPPTPAESCEEYSGVLMDIPGFHDPRIFWSGRGEPLMMVNSQSRYACFGLWVIDLRKLHDPLERLLGSHPQIPTLGPLKSYPSLTEITRNPDKTRGGMEKNWMFFGDKYGSYVHYDMGAQKRTFAKLLGGGLTTVNLTDSREIPCLKDAFNPEPSVGSWHQATNSLRLILCNRDELGCEPRTSNEVYFSLIHRKMKSAMGLPLRYERYFIVWMAQPPFSMLGVSKHPMLMANETVNGFEADESWQDDEENQALLAEGKEGKGQFASFFTYTVSIGWAWGRQNDNPQDKNVGYLNDEVILGIGLDDRAMVFSRVLARDLLQCLRACPGRAPEPISTGATDDEPSWVMPGPNPVVQSDVPSPDPEEEEGIEGTATDTEAASTSASTSTAEQTTTSSEG